MNAFWARIDVIHKAVDKCGTQDACHGHVGHNREVDVRTKFPKAQI